MPEEPSTSRRCWAPPGLTPAIDLPVQLLRKIVESAAGRALEIDHGIAVLGAKWRSGFSLGHLCREHCWRTHTGSVLVIPDLLWLEFQANNQNAQHVYYQHSDHRSVAVVYQHLMKI